MAPQLVKEPAAHEYRALKTSIIERDEVYMFELNGIKDVYPRRKIGDWVNASRFLSLIANKEEADRMKKVLSAQKSKLEMKGRGIGIEFTGFWVPLDRAREIAKSFSIYETLSPLLSFNRVALMNYAEVRCWEIFISLRVDLSVRILRKCDSSEVNMEQIFNLYHLSKGSKARRGFRMQFLKKYKGPKMIAKERTLLGGIWVPVTAARAFAQEHGIYMILSPILSFEKDPQEVDAFPLSKVESQLRKEWKILSPGYNAFHGFPLSFKLPDTAIRKRASALSLKDVCYVAKCVAQQQKRLKLKEYTLLRRKSDNYINASSLIYAACCLQMETESLSTRDEPEMQILVELYFTSLLDTFEFETVCTPRPKALNGRWIPLLKARELLTEFQIHDPKNINKLLYDPSIPVPFDASSGDEEDLEILEEPPAPKPVDLVDLENDTDDSDEEKLFIRSGGHTAATSVPVEEEYVAEAADEGDNEIGSVSEVVEINSTESDSELFGFENTSDASTDKEPSAQPSGKGLSEKELMLETTAARNSILFLLKTLPLNQYDMKELDKTIKKLESLPNMKLRVLQMTNITQALKQVVNVPSLEDKEKYRFHQRCTNILTKWSPFALDALARKGKENVQVVRNDDSTTNRKRGVASEEEERSAPPGKRTSKAPGIESIPRFSQSVLSKSHQEKGGSSPKNGTEILLNQMRHTSAMRGKGTELYPQSRAATPASRSRTDVLGRPRNTPPPRKGTELDFSTMSRPTLASFPNGKLNKALEANSPHVSEKWIQSDTSSVVDSDAEFSDVSDLEDGPQETPSNIQTYSLLSQFQSGTKRDLVTRSRVLWNRADFSTTLGERVLALLQK